MERQPSHDSLLSSSSETDLLSDMIPYRCPKCGSQHRFAALRDLKLHLEVEHSFKMGCVKPRARHQVFSHGINEEKSKVTPGKYVKTKHGSKFSPRSSVSDENRSSILKIYDDEAKVLELKVKMAKETEIKNKLNRNILLKTRGDNQVARDNLKENLTNINNQLMTSRHNEWRVAEALYQAEDVIQGVEEAAENRCLDQQSVIRDLVNDLRQKEGQLTQANRDLDKLRHEREALLCEVEDLFTEANTGNEVLREELGRRENMLGNVNQQLELLRSKARHDLDRKEGELMTAQGRVTELEEERQKLVQGTSGLLEQADQDRVQLRCILHDKERQLRQVNKDVDKLKTEQEDLIQESIDLYQKANEGTAKLKHLVQAKDNQLQEAYRELESMKEVHEKLIWQSQALTSQADSNNHTLTEMLRSKEEELERAKHELSKVKESNTAAFKVMLTEKEEELELAKSELARVKAEKDLMEENVRNLAEKAQDQDNKLEKLQEFVKEKEKKLLEKEREFDSLKNFLDSAAEKEVIARSRLEKFISGLIDRADKAESELQKLKSRSSSDIDLSRTHTLSNMSEVQDSPGGRGHRSTQKGQSDHSPKIRAKSQDSSLRSNENKADGVFSSKDIASLQNDQQRISTKFTDITEKKKKSHQSNSQENLQPWQKMLRKNCLSDTYNTDSSEAEATQPDIKHRDTQSQRSAENSAQGRDKSYHGNEHIFGNEDGGKIVHDFQNLHIDGMPQTSVREAGKDSRIFHPVQTGRGYQKTEQDFSPLLKTSHTKTGQDQYERSSQKCFASSLNTGVTKPEYVEPRENLAVTSQMSSSSLLSHSINPPQVSRHFITKPAIQVMSGSPSTPIRIAQGQPIISNVHPPSAQHKSHSRMYIRKKVGKRQKFIAKDNFPVERSKSESDLYKIPSSERSKALNQQFLQSCLTSHPSSPTRHVYYHGDTQNALSQMSQEVQGNETQQQVDTDFSSTQRYPIGPFVKLKGQENSETDISSSQRLFPQFPREGSEKYSDNDRQRWPIGMSDTHSSQIPNSVIRNQVYKPNSAIKHQGQLIMPNSSVTGQDQIIMPNSAVRGQGHIIMPNSALRGQGQIIMPNSAVRGQGQIIMPNNSVRGQEQIIMPNSVIRNQGKNLMQSPGIKGQGQIIRPNNSQGQGQVYLREKLEAPPLTHRQFKDDNIVYVPVDGRTGQLLAGQIHRSNGNYRRNLLRSEFSGNMEVAAHQVDNTHPETTNQSKIETGTTRGHDYDRNKSPHRNIETKSGPNNAGHGGTQKGSNAKESSTSSSKSYSASVANGNSDQDNSLSDVMSLADYEQFMDEPEDIENGTFEQYMDENGIFWDHFEESVDQSHRESQKFSPLRDTAASHLISHHKGVRSVTSDRDQTRKRSKSVESSHKHKNRLVPNSRSRSLSPSVRFSKQQQFWIQPDEDSQQGSLSNFTEGKPDFNELWLKDVSVETASPSVESYVPLKTQSAGSVLREGSPLNKNTSYQFYKIRSNSTNHKQQIDKVCQPSKDTGTQTWLLDCPLSIDDLSSVSERSSFVKRDAGKVLTGEDSLTPTEYLSPVRTKRAGAVSTRQQSSMRQSIDTSIQRPDIDGQSCSNSSMKNSGGQPENTFPSKAGHQLPFDSKPSHCNLNEKIPYKNSSGQPMPPNDNLRQEWKLCENFSQDNTTYDNSHPGKQPYDNSSQGRPPYDNFSSSRPPYGNSSLAKPLYDNSSQGSPPYSNSSQRRQPYDNYCQGRTPYDNSSQERPPYDNSSQGRLPYDKSSQARPPYDNSSQGRPPYDNSSQGRPPYDNSNQERPPYHSYCPGRPPYDNSSLVKPPYDCSIQGKPPHDNSSQGRSPYESSCHERPPCDISSEGKPGYDNSWQVRPPHDNSGEWGPPYDNFSQGRTPNTNLNHERSPYHNPNHGGLPYNISDQGRPQYDINKGMPLYNNSNQGRQSNDNSIQEGLPHDSSGDTLSFYENSSNRSVSDRQSAETQSRVKTDGSCRDECQDRKTNETEGTGQQYTDRDTNKNNSPMEMLSASDNAKFSNNDIDKARNEQQSLNVNLEDNLKGPNPMSHDHNNLVELDLDSNENQERSCSPQSRSLVSGRSQSPQSRSVISGRSRSPYHKDLVASSSSDSQISHKRSGLESPQNIHESAKRFDPFLESNERSNNLLKEQDFDRSNITSDLSYTQYGETEAKIKTMDYSSLNSANPDTSKHEFRYETSESSLLENSMLLPQPLSENSGIASIVHDDDASVSMDTDDQYSLYSMEDGSLSRSSSQESLLDRHPKSRREAVRQRRLSLFLVFSYLDTKTLGRMSLVCREWKKVSRQSALWKKVWLKDTRCTSNHLQTISQWCSQMENLHLEGLYSRRQLEMESQDDFSQAVRASLESGLEKLLQVSESSLRTLTVINCPYVLTDKSLWLASCYSRMLKNVCYHSNTHVLGPDVLWALGAGCGMIQSLDIAPLYPCHNTEKFTNKCLQIISQSLPDLDLLSVGGQHVDINGLVLIAKSCQRLYSFAIHSSVEVSEDVAVAMCRKGLKDLRSLAFHHTPITDKALLHFFGTCKHLKYIYVSFCIKDIYEESATKENMEDFNKRVKSLEKLKKKAGLGNILQLELIKSSDN